MLYYLAHQVIRVDTANGVNINKRKDVYKTIVYYHIARLILLDNIKLCDGVNPDVRHAG